MTKLFENKKKTIAERVAKEESSSDNVNKRVYYSPHHTVVTKDRETTKVRIVYDGSAN